MFIRSWGEILFDVALSAGMYWAGKSNGREEVQRQWNDAETNKQIEDLKKQIELLKQMQQAKIDEVI